MAFDHPPSFQFYPADFLSSTTVALMTPEEVGGYILLLCHAWHAEVPGTLPNDDDILARLSRLGDRWPICRQGILRAFKPGPQDGPPTIIQARMRNERRAQQRRYEQARKGASATNAARWSSVAVRHDSDSHSDRIAITPSSSSSSSSSKIESKDRSAAILAAVRTVSSKHPLRPSPPTNSPSFDPDRASRWLKANAPAEAHRILMKFAGWLWHTGTHDMDVLMAILEDRCRVNPDVAYAYYAPKSDARSGIEARLNIAKGEAENAAHKAADRAFLGQP